MENREYLNLQTGTRIMLGQLNEEELVFYQEALRTFAQNVDWGVFDELAFGAKSLVYLRVTSHQELRVDPLYLALKDMWLQLGVQQGKVARN